MRISAGTLKGRVLPVPSSARPTSARMREALADVWSHRLPGARVLELYAGSGAVGLELLSRGAGEVVFVDDDPEAIASLQVTCRTLAPGATRVLRAPLMQGLDRALADCAPFDLIFADPPYRVDDLSEVSRGLASWLAAEGEAAIEHSTRTTLSPSVPSLAEVERRTYGDQALTFLRQAGP